MAQRKPQPKRRPVAIARGETLERVIFHGANTPLSRRDLHVALEPIFRAWIAAACTWDYPAIGDYRFVVFALEVAPDTQLYVQFWSEPMEDVVWEVSSGRWNPPADEWLGEERARRIESLGFTIGGEAENYQRIVQVSSAGDAAAIAREVVRVFYTAFDYRGTAPIAATLVHDGRSETNETFDSFTPQDLAKLLTLLGFRVEEPVASDEDAADGAMLRCRKRGTTTLVEFGGAVADDLYETVTLSTDVPLAEPDRLRLKAEHPAGDRAEPVLSISVVLPFGGGVTLDWLVERIQTWEKLLAEHQRAVRRSRRASVLNPGEAVH